MRILKTMFPTILLLIAFFGSSNAQNSDAKLLLTQLSSESFMQTKSASADVVMKGEDANGQWTITLKHVAALTSSKGEKANVYTTEISQKGKVSTLTLAESNDNVYKVENGKVNQYKSRSSGRGARLAACVTSFLKNGGAGNCTTCLNAVKSCSGITPWYAYLICVGGKLASSTCKPCVTDVSNLLSCLSKAW